ncbi:MAG TPA: hypothetical protein VNE38_15100 [Ktedonobacteraceae bacterium]|nr:hypothetical protein [Ktedonobacteraceae bacterium]
MIGAAYGIPAVALELAQESPQRDPVSGKFRQVLAQSPAEKRSSNSE